MLYSEDAEVLWFNDHKGCGCAVTSKAKKVYIHYSSIQSRSKHKSLKEKQKVVVCFRPDQGKYIAETVKVIR